MSFTYLPDKFLWKKVNKVQYQEVFQTADFKARLADINKQLHADNINVQTMVDSLTEVMVLAGNKSLVKKSFRPTKKRIRKTNKTWYDKDCVTLLRELNTMKNAFNRNVSNDNLRIRYYRKYKEYKKLVKYKRRKYRENLTYMLNETMEHNPQTAWKIVNELKNDSLPPDKSEKINRT